MKNDDTKNNSAQKQIPSRRARAGGAGVSNLAAKLPDEQLQALIEGVRFAYAKPTSKTEFQKEFDERLDYHLRRRLLEESAATA